MNDEHPSPPAKSNASLNISLPLSHLRTFPLPGMTFSAQAPSCSPHCLPAPLPPPQRHFHFPHFLFFEPGNAMICVSVQSSLQPCLLLWFAAPISIAVGVHADATSSLLPLCLCSCYTPYGSAPLPHPISYHSKFSSVSSLSGNLPWPSQHWTLPCEVLLLCFHRTVRIPLSWTESWSLHRQVFIWEPQRMVPREEGRFWESLSLSC